MLFLRCLIIMSEMVGSTCLVNSGAQETPSCHCGSARPKQRWHLLPRGSSCLNALMCIYNAVLCKFIAEFPFWLIGFSITETVSEEGREATLQQCFLQCEKYQHKQAFESTFQLIFKTS